VIMNNKLTKIPLVGVGAGYGVAVDPRADQRTYLRMSRFDLGMGWGARAIRPVMIFHDAEKFRKFIDGDFDLTLGAEASAKVGEKGGAGGGAGESQKKDLGYKSYVITDAGVSATASLAVIRVKRVNLKK
jgi:lipid-binding SYLF domain-containing protein